MNMQKSRKYVVLSGKNYRENKKVIFNVELYLTHPLYWA